jgi:sirohydrochlorin ferrochelatase
VREELGYAPEPSAGMRPILVACSHGSTTPAGRQAIARLCAEIGERRPGLDVVQAFADVQRPYIGEVIRRLVGWGRTGVVVPLLLSPGYHIRVDVAGAVAGTGWVAAGPLGPDPVLIDVLADRLGDTFGSPPDAGSPRPGSPRPGTTPPVTNPPANHAATTSAGPALPDHRPVVLAAAGSGDPRAALDVSQLADDLARRTRRPVFPGYLSTAQPTVPDAIATARAAYPGAGVDVLPYLLAPGYFTTRLAALSFAAGASWVGPPLAGHRALAPLALQRYDVALAARNAAGGTPSIPA